MWVPVGSVDHHRPLAPVRGLPEERRAYEWGNLRFAAEWVNRHKSDAEWPDPFEVQDDWFEILLPSLELIATPHVPANHLDAVKRALDLLGRSPKVLKVRQQWWTMYLQGEVTVDGLERMAPLLAAAIRREGWMPSRPEG